MKKAPILATLPLLVACATSQTITDIHETENLQTKTRRLIECVLKNGKPENLGYPEAKIYKLETKDPEKQELHLLVYTPLNPKIDSHVEYLRLAYDIRSTVVNLIDYYLDGRLETGAETLYKDRTYNDYVSTTTFMNLPDEKKNPELAEYFQKKYVLEIDYFLKECDKSNNK